MLCICAQDTVLIVPPYPYNVEEDRHDVPLEDCWYARPQRQRTVGVARLARPDSK